VKPDAEPHLPEGQIALALTERHRLPPTTEGAQTVIATRPALTREAGQFAPASN
jgi:hypothetical protein